MATHLQRRSTINDELLKNTLDATLNLGSPFVAQSKPPSPSFTITSMARRRKQHHHLSQIKNVNALTEEGPGGFVSITQSLPQNSARARLHHPPITVSKHRKE
jgi:hypothetical protein